MEMELKNRVEIAVLKINPISGITFRFAARAIIESL
jgi:hypothetical protein